MLKLNEKLKNLIKKAKQTFSMVDFEDDIFDSFFRSSLAMNNLRFNFSFVVVAVSINQSIKFESHFHAKLCVAKAEKVICHEFIIKHFVLLKIVEHSLCRSLDKCQCSGKISFSHLYSQMNRDGVTCIRFARFVDIVPLL